MCASVMVLVKLAEKKPTPLTDRSTDVVLGAVLGIAEIVFRKENAFDSFVVPAAVVMISGSPFSAPCIGVIATNALGLTGVTFSGRPPSVAVIEPGMVGSPVPVT